MIVLLQGLLMDKTVEHAVIDVHGVGYQADIPLSTYYVLPGVGESVTLRTTMYVREDAMRLYGFATEEERSLFEILITVSSIGPRLALNMLSSIPAGDLQACIAQAEVSRLQTIPGIGRKTAERVVLELQEKIVKLDMAPSGVPRGRFRRMSRWWATWCRLCSIWDTSATRRSVPCRPCAGSGMGGRCWKPS